MRRGDLDKRGSEGEGRGAWILKKGRREGKRWRRADEISWVHGKRGNTCGKSYKG